MGKKNDLIILRHSAAHLLAHAIHELYPETILTIGPATKDDFHGLLWQRITSIVEQK